MRFRDNARDNLQPLRRLFKQAVFRSYSQQILPFAPNVAAKKGQGFFHKGQEFIHHTDLPHEESAFHSLLRSQKLWLGLGALIYLTLLAINWHITIVVSLATLIVLYFADLLFNCFLIYRSFTGAPEIHIGEQQIANVPEQAWPSYSIFCPLYKEWQVLPQFVEAMQDMDYPKDRLQVLLLLEQDDAETIARAQELDLPAYFELVVVPHSLPKTKPKAMNYGLKHVRGDYLAIYDAEDVPDPLQLKKVK